MNKRLWRRIGSDRASALLEYALVTSLVAFVAGVALTPGSEMQEGIGADWNLRETFIKLPIF